MNSPSLRPLRSVIVISANGVAELEPGAVSSERVGWKAYGLSAVPADWSTAFFVVDADCLDGATEALLNKWVEDCLRRIGAAPDTLFLVRSSGTAETVRERGRLITEQSVATDIVRTIRSLTARLPHTNSGRIHWIVQPYITARSCGQLSNERRISYESRDWIVEAEPSQVRPGYSTSLAVRRWRDRTVRTGEPLSCTSEMRVTICLRRVANWATQFSHRTLIEWVWDGAFVWVVQADIAEPAAGVAPEDVMPDHVEAVHVGSLQCFRVATDVEYAMYPKLANAKLYASLGYSMPSFYVLDDPDLIADISRHVIPTSLRADLDALTSRPLVIRTDGVSIPPDQREMLPRSENIRNAHQAIEWLAGGFRAGVSKIDLSRSSLCLIAHHFIPSVSSAWARAEPLSPVVRVEALWGVPEGLYYFSHDTFEVDTATVELPLARPLGRVSYNYWQRLRFKGSFIAPDATGKWVLHQPAAPFDWRRSVRREQWLFEIALTTRRIAEHDGHAVSVMWFIDNHHEATPHRVLPWFHDQSDLSDAPKGAPRRKWRGSRDYRIETMIDWVNLRKAVEAGETVERVIVEPVEPDLIRNPEFAEALSELARSAEFVVELSGGILSHVYHILRRGGARVECVDLFGEEEDVLEFNKVVRDKIAESIIRRGEKVETVRLTRDALLFALKQKLVEEAFEALDSSSGEDLIGEVADVLEVIHGLCRALEVPVARVEAARKMKQRRRGGFEHGFMLMRTATPHSIRRVPRFVESLQAELDVPQHEETVISEVDQLPVRSVLRKPDLRKQREREFEKMLTVETDILLADALNQELEFSFSDEHPQRERFVLALEMQRTRGALRAVVRLRKVASQLELAFPDLQMRFGFTSSPE